MKYRQDCRVNIASLKEKLASEDIDDIYDALIDIGKTDCYELMEYVRRFLQHPEPDLKRAAIMVLGTCWSIPDFKHELIPLMSKDEDDDVRATALINWVGYYAGTKDPAVLLTLNDLLRDKTEDLFVRMEALRGIARVAQTDIDEKLMRELERASSYAEFESLIPWDWVDDIIAHTV
ncbi:HEAT repeat domain-containing protein [Hahella sp. CR1]|uniref:HEAT repeat domain-containing protein n=1 Tax=Hahella sp. CR1 TaxID=2992807 RepID=UPI0024423AB1|nr:HEAT repeat domain-containing protein [Hahella sp. CR1]MDG9669339.1 HEAT repeat domain-containing protein [Hahella sp. CR1]